MDRVTDRCAAWAVPDRVQMMGVVYVFRSCMCDVMVRRRGYAILVLMNMIYVLISSAVLRRVTTGQRFVQVTAAGGRSSEGTWVLLYL